MLDLILFHLSPIVLSTAKHFQQGKETQYYNNIVAGFISTNGSGNIFENCIANATQALSTTDSNSLVAGFALRGTESYCKIIGCESANASASSTGVTVPYGILLQATLSCIIICGANEALYCIQLDNSMRRLC